MSGTGVAQAARLACKRAHPQWRTAARGVAAIRWAEPCWLAPRDPRPAAFAHGASIRPRCFHSCRTVQSSSSSSGGEAPGSGEGGSPPGADPPISTAEPLHAAESAPDSAAAPAPPPEGAPPRRRWDPPPYYPPQGAVVKLANVPRDATAEEILALGAPFKLLDVRRSWRGSVAWLRFAAWADAEALVRELRQRPATLAGAAVVATHDTLPDVKLALGAASAIGRRGDVGTPDARKRRALRRYLNAPLAEDDGVRVELDIRSAPNDMDDDIDFDDDDEEEEEAAAATADAMPPPAPDAAAASAAAEAAAAAAGQQDEGGLSPPAAAAAEDAAAAAAAGGALAAVDALAASPPPAAADGRRPRPPRVPTLTYDDLFAHTARTPGHVLSPYDAAPALRGGAGIVEAFDRVVAGEAYDRVVADMGLALDPAAEARFAAWEARVRELGDDLAEPGLPDDLAEAWDVPPLAPPPPNQVAKEQRRAAAAARAGRYQLLSDEDESDHGSDFDANAADVDAEMVGEDGEDLVDYGTGDWVEHLVMQDRTQKITKSGQIMSYRTLVTVGNANGTGGFGMGKGAEPQQSVVRAFRDARRSLIYVERYKMSGLLYPLYGEHNNLKVYIYPTRPGSGLRAGDIIEGILEGFGIADATAKAYGKRHPYSVVRATFNALLGHEGLHDVAMRRGARILSVHKTLLGRHHRDDPRYY